MLVTLKAARSDCNLWVSGVFFDLFFQIYRSRTIAGELSQKILGRCIGSQQSWRIFKLGRPKIMTLLEACVTLVVILLSAITTWAWITMRKRAPRNWDFKERSLQYLNDVHRQRRQIPTPGKLDQEMAD
jgi:hypothetical protein